MEPELEYLGNDGVVKYFRSPFFTLRRPQTLAVVECYRLNEKCPSQAHVLYTWSTVLAGFGKFGGQGLYEENLPRGCFPWNILSIALVCTSAFVSCPPECELFLP